jgi:hypothetical protein
VNGQRNNRFGLLKHDRTAHPPETECELLFDGMTQAGDRLIAALRVERKLDILYRKNRTSLYLRILIDARRTVDDLAQKYMASISKYRDSIIRGEH